MSLASFFTSLTEFLPTAHAEEAQAVSEATGSKGEEESEVEEAPKEDEEEDEEEPEDVSGVTLVQVVEAFVWSDRWKGCVFRDARGVIGLFRRRTHPVADSIWCTAAQVWAPLLYACTIGLTWSGRPVEVRLGA